MGRRVSPHVPRVACLHVKEQMNLALPTNHQPVSLLEEQDDDEKSGSLSSVSCTNLFISGTGSWEARTSFCNVHSQSF